MQNTATHDAKAWYHSLRGRWISYSYSPVDRDLWQLTDRVRESSPRTRLVYVAINPWLLGYKCYISHPIGPQCGARKATVAVLDSKTNRSTSKMACCSFDRLVVWLVDPVFQALKAIHSNSRGASKQTNRSTSKISGCSLSRVAVQWCEVTCESLNQCFNCSASIIREYHQVIQIRTNIVDELLLVSSYTSLI